MDDGSLFLLAGLIVLYLLVGPGLGIAAFFRGKGASASDVAALRAQIDRPVMEVSILPRRAPDGDPATEAATRSAERRGGNEGSSTSRSGLSPQYKHKK